MALPFSQKTDAPEKNRLVQKERASKLQKDKRQLFILNTVTDGVKQAHRRIKFQESQGTPGYQVTIRLDFWTKNSAFLLHDYRGLTPHERDTAIGIDVAYLLEEVDKLAKQYREWEIEVKYPHKGSTLPNQLFVRKNKK